MPTDPPLLFSNDDLYLFDVDGTLFHGDSTVGFVRFVLEEEQRSGRLFQLKMGTRRWSPFFWTLAIAYKFFQWDWGRQFYLSLLKGIPQNRLNDLAQQYVEHTFFPQKIEATHQILQAALARGQAVCLISAGLACVMSRVAQKLGVEIYFASTLKYQNGLCCGKLELDLLGKKAQHLSTTQWYHRPWIVISDNVSDIDLMARAKENYAVVPKRKRGKQQDFWAQYEAKILYV